MQVRTSRAEGRRQPDGRRHSPGRCPKNLIMLCTIGAIVTGLLLPGSWRTRL